MKESTYQAGVLAVKNGYAPRIEQLLRDIASTLKALGYVCDDEPTDLSGDGYSWNLIVYVASKPGGNLADNDVDITFKICESLDHEGTTDGITFNLDIVEVGGRILGGLSPYNYSPEVWVPVTDPTGIESRFELFEQADAESIADLLLGATA